MKINITFFLLILCGFIMSLNTRADASSVDKVYHPYVTPLEREVEWRITFDEQDSHERDNNLMSRLGYGMAVSETVSLEFYAIGEREQDNRFGLKGYELEARWMITEQGEYDIDWGAIFELERLEKDNQWEFSAGIITEQEFGRYSLTTNTILEYEKSLEEKRHIDAQFRLQYRYRWKPSIQPGIEFHTYEDQLSIGPSAMGLYRIAGQKQIKWEFGLMFGLNTASTNQSLRFAIEYEF